MSNISYEPEQHVDALGQYIVLEAAQTIPRQLALRSFQNPPETNVSSQRRPGVPKPENYRSFAVRRSSSFAGQQFYAPEQYLCGSS